MAFSLFAPPQTNWLTARREREGGAVGPYEQAIGATRRDALTAARGVAGPGGGAAAARTATQAVAPELARLRAAQANALTEERGRIRADQERELVARGEFMNNLIGGLGGIFSQAAVPLLSGLGGNGSAPAAPAAPAGPSMPAAPAAPAATPNYGLLPASAGPPMGSAPAPTPTAPAAATASLVGPDGLTEEERRRRTMGGGGLGGLANAAAPFAGMVNPLFGLGLGAAGRLF